MDIFHGPSLKLERAKHHIKDFVSKAETFYSKTSPKFFIQDYPQTRQRTLCVDVDTSVPDELPLILGDAIHNLRSALDHLTWDVVSPLNPPRPGDVQFPFCRKKEGFEAAISHRQIDLAGEKIVEKFRELKPYPSGNDLLYALHKLDIADKHQLIVPVVSLVGFETLNLREVHPLAPNHTIQRSVLRHASNAGGGLRGVHPRAARRADPGANPPCGLIRPTRLNFVVGARFPQL